MRVEMEVRHLRLLVAIAEEGSLTAAARQLHLTQSALSHQLRDAEEKLQAQLFDRVNKKLVPTRAGEHALMTAQRVLRELQQTEAAIRLGAANQRRALRLATECYTCYHWLPGVLAKFQKTHPAVEVRIDLASTHDPLLALKKGALDLAIVYSEDSTEEFQLLPLFSDEMVVLLPPRHRLAAKKSISAEDFEGETLFIYPPRRENLLLARVLKPAGIEAGAIQEVPLTEAILEFVASGLGIGFLARWAAEPYINRRKLVAKSLAGGKWKRTWKAAFLSHGNVPAHVRDFVRFVREQRGRGEGALNCEPGRCS